jgi:hypothetical protein
MPELRKRFNFFFLFAEKELGLALKNRVGRETGNTGIIFYGLKFEYSSFRI